MRRPRTVIVGAAHWHVPLYVAALSDVTHVIGVHDEHPSLISDVAAALGVKPLGDLDALLDLPDIELALVFGPHDRMARTCHVLVERGIPFIVEKPAGVSGDELRSLERAARAAGVAATVPLVQRDGPVEAFLRQAGEVVYHRSSFIAGPPARYRRSGNDWMLDQQRSGGGCLINLGPHFIDLFVRAVGTADLRVAASASSRLHGEGVEDHATIVLTTPDGREGVVEVGYAFPDSPLKQTCSFTVAGRAGYASVSGDGVATFSATAGRTTRANLDVRSDPLYDVFVRTAVTRLDTGFEGLPSLAELAGVMDVVWESYRQIRGHLTA